MIAINIFNDPAISNFSANGIYTIAVMDGSNSEKYETIKFALSASFDELEQLANHEHTKIEGLEDFNFDVSLCGDLKFLDEIMECKAATANHPCVFCHVHKNDLNVYFLDERVKKKSKNYVVIVMRLVQMANNVKTWFI